VHRRPPRRDPSQGGRRLTAGRRRRRTGGARSGGSLPCAPCRRGDAGYLNRGTRAGDSGRARRRRSC
jgi:hypothetical protein